jgi:nucleoid-associated protein YgaU
LSIICLLSSGLFAGCVSSEKYEAEKARALNFQRLLAQEERRTGELNTQVQGNKRQMASVEAQNKDLTIELDALRDQMSRQDSNRDSMGSSSGLSDFSSGSDLSLSEPSLSEFGLSDLSFDESDFKNFGEVSGGGESTSYTVVRGDTLYRISKEFGVTVGQLKDWNNLFGDSISIGQQLTVGQN